MPFALTSHIHLGGVCAFCCRALGVLAAASPPPRIRAHLLSAGAPAALVATLGVHRDRADVAHFGCKALANLGAWEGGWEAVIAAGGASAAADALRTHAASSPAVAHYGCKALAVAAAGPAGGDAAAARPGRDAVARAGGVRVLLSVAEPAEAPEEALYYALKGAAALAGPAAATPLRAAVVDAGWPGLVMRVLRTRGMASLALSSAALRVVAAICVGQGAGRGAIVAAGGAGVVVPALNAKGAEHEVLAVAGVVALGALVDGTAPEIAAFSAAGGVKAIVAAMSAHEGSGSLAGAGCDALAHCAVFLRKDTLEAGALEAVARAEAAHPECSVVADGARRAMDAKHLPAPHISSFSKRPSPF